MYVSTCVVEGLRCFFIEPQNGFFAVDSVYGRRDDGMRFEFFCKVGRRLAGRQTAQFCRSTPCVASRPFRMTVTRARSNVTHVIRVM